MSFGQSYKNQTGDSGTSGFVILTNEANANGYRTASLSRTSPTIFRVIPEVDPTTGQLLPFRNGSGPGEFTNWIVALETAVMGINGTISFICQLRDPNDENRVLPVSHAVPPPTLFHKRMKELVKDPRYAAWHVHLQGETGKAASVQPTQRCGFVQGFLMYANGKPCNPPMAKQVLVLRKTARQALEDACNEENPQQMWGGDPNSPYRFKANDFVSASHGRLITFKLNGTSSAVHPANAAALSGSFSNFNPTAAFGAGGHDDKRGNTEFQRYVCEIAPPDQLSPIQPEWVHACWRPWERLLQLHSAGDQLMLMARVIPKEMLVATLGDEEYFPNSLKTGIVYNAPTGPIAPPNTWNPGAPATGAAPAFIPGFSVAPPAPAGPVPGYPAPSMPGLTMPPAAGVPAPIPNPQYPGYAANTGFPPAEMPSFAPGGNPASPPPVNPSSPAFFPGGNPMPPMPPGNPAGPSYAPAGPAFFNTNPAAPNPNPGVATAWGAPPAAPSWSPPTMPGYPAAPAAPSFFPSTNTAPSPANMNVPPTAFDPGSAPPPPPVTTAPVVSVPTPVTVAPAAPSPYGPPSVPAVLNPAAPAAPGFNAPPGANPNTAAVLEAMRVATGRVSGGQPGHAAPVPGGQYPPQG